jgi:hypothetical protein
VVIRQQVRLAIRRRRVIRHNQAHPGIRSRLIRPISHRRVHIRRLLLHARRNRVSRWADPATLRNPVTQRNRVQQALVIRPHNLDIHRHNRKLVTHQHNLALVTHPRSLVIRLSQVRPQVDTRRNRAHRQLATRQQVQQPVIHRRAPLQQVIRLNPVIHRNRVPVIHRNRVQVALHTRRKLVQVALVTRRNRVRMVLVTRLNRVQVALVTRRNLVQEALVIQRSRDTHPHSPDTHPRNLVQASAGYRRVQCSLVICGSQVRS